MVRVVSQEFDSSVLINHELCKHALDAQIERILYKHPIWKPETYKQWLIKAVSLIDLTTLSGDDTVSNVARLCVKAANPLSSKPDNDKVKGKIQTAAVCVYPSRVQDAYRTIDRMGLIDDIRIASVATGFPSGLYPLSTRLLEIKFSVANGANEIDVVLDRSLVLTGQWNAIYDEVSQMKQACGNAHLKVILGVGELGTYENVYNASLVAMFAGADFIKTSTGKETVNATLPVGLVMCRAIRHFYQMTGFKVGLKPAGGIKSSRDAVNWLVLIYSELGPEWLTPQLFRIGASSLLAELDKDIQNIIL